MYERLVFIVGMPRSGTSWLSQILDSSPQVAFRLSPFFAYAFKDRVNTESNRDAFEMVFRQAYALEDEFMSQSYRRRAGEYPLFEEKEAEPPVLVIKMTRFHHLLPRLLHLFPDLKTVAIVRHPCGAIHSWLTTPGEFPAGADPLQEWRTGACRKNRIEEFWGFEDWKRVTRLHLDLMSCYPQRFRIVQYERLVADRFVETRALFTFLGLAYSSQTERFLHDSMVCHHQHSHAVFKSPAVKDRWRTGLQAGIQQAIIHELCGTDLETFLV